MPQYSRHNSRFASSAERGQVTALSYDLVGSTRLASRLDPEDMRDVQRSFHDACTLAVERYGGYIDTYSGDGAMVFFGYPIAQEDAPERAVFAGLQIISECDELNKKLHIKDICLAVRVGIATGPVVASYSNSQHADIVGMAPNLAFKLQAAAAPNSVLISGLTHDLTKRRFKYECFGDLVLSGLTAPVNAWVVLQSRRHSTRFQAAMSHVLTPIVGRKFELSTIAALWRKSLEGIGQLVLISGEPGIGKSRLAASIHRLISSHSHLSVVLQCSSLQGDTALYPIITQLERALDISPAEPPEAVTVRLTQLLATPRGASDNLLPLVARLLGLPATLPDVSTQVVKERTLEALLDWVERLAAMRPMLLLLEDAQWIDPTSQDLLDRALAVIPRLRVLAVVTSRLEYQPNWSDTPHITRLHLGRLDKEHCATIARHILRQNMPSDHVVSQIVAHSDGIPFFVEELSRAVRDGQLSFGAMSPPVPPTLSDSLAARLSQLGQEKEVAQIGSAIGRSFTRTIAKRLAIIDERTLDRGLTKLVELGLARRRGEDHYTFEHALIQSAAYESMLRNKRIIVHERIGAILEHYYAGRREATPQILGHHFAEAGMIEKAIANFKEAAGRAAAASANVEAGRLLERAIGLLATVPEGSRKKELELSLLTTLGTILITINGPGAVEVHSLYERATLLCNDLPESKLHFVAHWGWWRIAPNAAELRSRADQLSTVADALADPELRLQAHHSQWATLFNSGEFEKCEGHIFRGIEIYAGGDYRLHGTLYGGHDPNVCAYGERALLLWLTGFPEQALNSVKTALAHAETLQHAASIGHARDIEIMLLKYCNDAPGLISKTDAMMLFAETYGFRDLAAKAIVFKGWAMAKLGEPDAGIRLIEEGLNKQRKLGTQEDIPIYFEMLAEAYGMAGIPEAGVPLVEEAISMVTRSGLTYWLAELWRSKGHLAAAHESAYAMTCFERSIEIATSQKARSLLLRGAMSKARLLQQLGHRREAQECAANIYGTFTEGFDSSELISARDFLGELS